MRIHVPVYNKISYTTMIVPVFLPFWGCVQRCIFCAQHVQTGVLAVSSKEILYRVRQQLDARLHQAAPPVELGFFGGTFTCLPEPILQECIDLVQEYTVRGAVVAARCSTRPDALNPAILQHLHTGGFSTVELGVQSFADAALQASCRGYDGACARAACAMVRAAGLKLGVQLLPGLPGVEPEVFITDVQWALECGAQFLRFYPCLVIAGTELARMWQEGAFNPWTLDATVDTLARAYAMSMARGVPVIRMGLAPEKSLLPEILAGPQHPALGSMVQGLALVQAAEQALQGRVAQGADVPRWCQGFFWGHAQSLLPRWAELGIRPDTVRWDRSAGAECVLHL